MKREKIKSRKRFLNLLNHEFVGKMRIDSAGKPFGGITHPNVHDIGTDILLTYVDKSTAEIVLRDFFIFHNSFENTVEYVRLM